MSLLFYFVTLLLCYSATLLLLSILKEYFPSLLEKPQFQLYKYLKMNHPCSISLKNQKEYYKNKIILLKNLSKFIGVMTWIKSTQRLSDILKMLV